MEDKKVKKYDSVEALKIVKNFVEKEYEDGREKFRRYVESELDKHADYSVTEDAYANYWVGKIQVFTEFLRKSGKSLETERLIKFLAGAVFQFKKNMEDSL